jgi:hypothetical protein
MYFRMFCIVSRDIYNAKQNGRVSCLVPSDLWPTPTEMGFLISMFVGHRELFC